MKSTINYLIEMGQETKELSEHIASLKRNSRIMPDGPDKEKMMKEIKLRRNQVMFYIKKMENAWE